MTWHHDYSQANLGPSRKDLRRKRANYCRKPVNAIQIQNMMIRLCCQSSVIYGMAEIIDGRPNGRPLRVFFDEWDIDDGQNVRPRW